MKYRVLVDNHIVKEYPYKLQAIIYCFLNNYVTTGRRYYWLNERVKIEKA